MSSELAGKTIIVTGAGSGIGKASARLFAMAGAYLLLADVNVKNGESLANELTANGKMARFIRTDVSSEDDVRAMVDAALDSFSRIDGAFNNAGVGYSNKRLHLVEQAEWHHTLGIDLTGVFLCMKYEIAAMLKTGGGSIVNTGSVASILALPAAPEYVTARHGILGPTRSAALDYGKDKIRVNVIYPGATDTPMINVQQQKRIAAQEKGTSHQPVLGRSGSAEEVGQGALWLLSDAASYVTGSALTVDGGFTLQ
ncbi:SDR family NAD(P)-dependent oxidoreductase [Acerihabitans arboris]|uniref:SDR family oxidoreductase n=1 Tax=Acerihabitans arboris TaxID=2691583 RepID=A0A845SB38_9GAMM|nr:SDR family oxidoreductase [Acerihabitans arboris]NDL62033.1 SDR family oxidoreductase [Acerihabitans arboris]